jgi:hypothetical protein
VIRDAAAIQGAGIFNRMVALTHSAKEETKSQGEPCSQRRALDFGEGSSIPTAVGGSLLAQGWPLLAQGWPRGTNFAELFDKSLFDKSLTVQDRPGREVRS